MPFAEVRGIRLHWSERGSGDPLICVMGLGADQRAWVFQLEPFSEAFRTIVFDNRDCGQSSLVDEDYDLDDMAGDTLALADELGLESFHLLGISMGAAICQHAALRAPARVRTLTLAAAWGGASATYGEMRARNWAREVSRASREEFLETMMLLTLSERFFDIPGGVKQFKKLALAAPHAQPPEAFARQSRASARHDVRDRLAELTMPVHVISGANDVLIPPWKQQELAALIPGAKLTVLEGVAHSMNLDGAEAFTAAVLDFLASA